MPIDAYENLVLGGRGSGRARSSDELLDQINRDIAIWRSDKELDEEWDRLRSMEPNDEEEWDDRMDFPFDNARPWQSTGDVLSRRYADFSPEGLYDDEDDEMEEDWDMMDDEDEDDEFFGISDNEIPFGSPGDEDDSFDFLNEEESDVHEPQSHEEEIDEMQGIRIEDIPFDPPMPETKEVPYVPLGSVADWEEEHLPEEDPIFLEEPV